MKKLSTTLAVIFLTFSTIGFSFADSQSTTIHAQCNIQFISSQNSAVFTTLVPRNCVFQVNYRNFAGTDQFAQTFSCLVNPGQQSCAVDVPALIPGADIWSDHTPSAVFVDPVLLASDLDLGCISEQHYPKAGIAEDYVQGVQNSQIFVDFRYSCTKL